MGDGKALRILRFEAENVKALKAVAITPSGALVEILGDNAQGKSSVLDAVWFAIGGGSVQCEQPIRQGESKARVTLDLGELKVTRTWTAKGSTLKVQTAEGATLAKPQQVLAGLVREAGFDAMGFSRLKPKDRREELLKLIESPVDFAELAKERKALFDSRTDANREVARLTAALASAAPADPTLPQEPEDPKALADELMAATESNAKIQELTRKVGQQAELVAELQERVKKEEAELLALQEQLAPLRVEPTAELRERFDSVTERNKAIAAQQERRRLSEALAKAEKESLDLTESIGDVDRVKAEALAKGLQSVPVKGLGFNDEDLTIGGVPFSQASTSEKIRVGLSLAMSSNPRLRVAMVHDGSLLDDKAMAELESWASEHDTQVWIERVGFEGDGWVIEAGEVAAEPDRQGKENA